MFHESEIRASTCVIDRRALRQSFVNVAVSTVEARLEAWCSLIGLALDDVDERVLAAATDLLESIDHRSAGAQTALHRFGYTLGTDGWPIAQVSSWLVALSRCVKRPHRKLLSDFSAQNWLAQGWAEGYVRGAHTGVCIDPSTGLVTAVVLRLRMLEVYQHAWVAVEVPSELYVLVVVDIDLHDLSVIDADLRIAVVADTVAAVFRHGDTIARVGSRLVVMASNTEHTDQRVAVLADRLRIDIGTRAAHATVMTDAMPATAELVDAYLRDLAG